MAPEDLNQIRALIREETGKRHALIREETSKLEMRIVERISTATAASLSDLREELTRRMDSVERRLDTFAIILFSVDQRTAALARAIDDVLRVHDRTAGAQAGIDRTIQQILARLDALERKQDGGQS